MWHQVMINDITIYQDLGADQGGCRCTNTQLEPVLGILSANINSHLCLAYKSLKINDLKHIPFCALYQFETYSNIDTG